MYPKTHCDIISEGDNVIVGLGDSFTQGVGAYSLETWASIPNNPAVYNISGQLFLEEQGKNNWLTQLRNIYFPNYKVYNLGVNGGGNRATIKELYLYPLPPKLKNVIVIMMVTGLERYDFLKKEDSTAGINWHQKWQTIWPIDNGNRGSISMLEKAYLQNIWSLRNDILEFLFNIKDIQNYCYLNGYKFMFAPSFDQMVNKIKMMKALENKAEFINMVNWDDFINLGPYKSFMDMLNQLEGNPPMGMHEIFQGRQNSLLPSKFITPCSHWSIEGCKKVADHLYNEIKARNLA